MVNQPSKIVKILYLQTKRLHSQIYNAKVKWNLETVNFLVFLSFTTNHCFYHLFGFGLRNYGIAKCQIRACIRCGIIFSFTCPRQILFNPFKPV